MKERERLDCSGWAIEGMVSDETCLGRLAAKLSAPDLKEKAKCDEENALLLETVADALECVSDAAQFNRTAGDADAFDRIGRAVFLLASVVRLAADARKVAEDCRFLTGGKSKLGGGHVMLKKLWRCLFPPRVDVTSAGGRVCDFIAVPTYWRWRLNHE